MQAQRVKLPMGGPTHSSDILKSKAVPLPEFTPADLIRPPEPFDHDDFIFELRMDGFRALAYCDHDEVPG